MAFAIPTSLRAPLITGGSLFGASMLGSKLAKSSPSELEQQQIDLLTKTGQRGQQTGTNLFDMGLPAAQQPIDYWSSILSGDRSKMTSAMGPELSRIGEGYQAAAKTSTALNPRGGPTPDFLSQLPYNQQRDVSTMFQQARPDAAKQLSGAGSNLIANATTALNSSTAAGRTLLDFEQQRRERDREAGAGIGKTIYDIFYPANGQPGLASTLGDIFKSKVGAAAGGAGSAAAGGAAVGAGTAGMSSIGAATPFSMASLAAPGMSTVAANAAAAPFSMASLGAGASAAGAAGGAAAPITGFVGPTLPAGAGAGSGLGSTIAGLATNPITIGVAAALAGTIALLKSQAHHEANTWVKGFQNPFDQQMDQLNRQFHAAAQSEQLSKEQASAIRDQVAQLAAGYQQKLSEFERKGSDERTVGRQARATADKYYGPGFSTFLNGMDQVIQGLR